MHPNSDRRSEYKRELREFSFSCASVSSRINVNPNLQGDRERSSGGAPIRILGRFAGGGDGTAFGSSGNGDHGSPRLELRVGGTCGRNGRRTPARKTNATRQEEEKEYEKKKTRRTGSLSEFVGREGQSAISGGRIFRRVTGVSRSASFVFVIFVNIDETRKKM